MSLINEALKRTRDATYQSAARSNDLTGYRYEGGRQSFSSTPKAWIVAATVVAVGGLALGFLFLTTRRPQAVAAGPVQVATVAPAPKPVDDALVAQVVEKLRAEKVVTAAPTQTVVVAAPSPVPEPPKLKLQGTTIENGLKEALINGQNLRIGDEIEGARLVEIEYRRVKLQWRDQELALRMY
jgi:hypothetical protein